MIEQLTIGGLPATVAYTDSDMQPVDKSMWRMMHVLFDDGGSQIIINQDEPEATLNLPETAVWSRAIEILDESEPKVRDVIERGFASVARLKHVRLVAAENATRKVLREVHEIRTAALKKAFRFIRSQLGDDPIMGISLSRWAAAIVRTDAAAIATAVRAALASGRSNTAIARAVIGSMSKNGVDGATQFTRQRMAHLARSSIRAQKDG